MKALIIILTLTIGFSASAQVRTQINSEVKFVYPDGISPEPIIHKKDDNKKTYILVANETAGKMSKFEIDIFAGNKDMSKATLLVYLSAKSPNRAYLSSGTYKYSNKNLAERDEYDFYGTVRLGSADIPISDGWFSVNSVDKHMTIKYEFTLTNGVKTIGEYNLPFQFVDRRQ